MTDGDKRQKDITCKTDYLLEGLFVYKPPTLYVLCGRKETQKNSTETSSSSAHGKDMELYLLLHC